MYAMGHFSFIAVQLMTFALALALAPKLKFLTLALVLRSKVLGLVVQSLDLAETGHDFVSLLTSLISLTPSPSLIVAETLRVKCLAKHISNENALDPDVVF